MNIDSSFWLGRRVLLTGHTGFKGAWLSLWLQTLGAQLVGLSLEDPPTEPSLYTLAHVRDGLTDSVVCDIRDPVALARELTRAAPEIVIHMAAQPLVRRSFASPRETFNTNVMGTVNLLDSVRACASVRVVVVVTSDKCYENDGSSHVFRESDPLGGHDPYSTSKAAAELITSAYRRSFFSDPSGPRLASARAGNVIGGGDWGEDRLIPDIIRASLSGDMLQLRYPQAVRPWQHVLSPLSGYLLLAHALFESPDYARAWNFGPPESDARTVEWVVERFSDLWPGGVPWERTSDEHPHEAAYLRLDSSQARERLEWAPVVGLDAGLEATVEWYRAWQEGQDLRQVTLGQIEKQTSMRQAAELGLDRPG